MMTSYSVEAFFSGEGDPVSYAGAEWAADGNPDEKYRATLFPRGVAGSAGACISVQVYRADLKVWVTSAHAGVDNCLWQGKETVNFEDAVKLAADIKKQREEVAAAERKAAEKEARLAKYRRDDTLYPDTPL